MAKTLAPLLALAALVPGCFTTTGGFIGASWAAEHNRAHRPVSVGSSIAAGIAIGLVLDGLLVYGVVSEMAHGLTYVGRVPPQ